MISIIIIVKNDPSISSLLEKLDRVKKPEKAEIVVVDASMGKLDYIKEKFHKIRWINFENTSKKKITIPEQRNLGVIKSKGNIIVFIDAGCNPEKNWLVNLTKPLRNENENFVTGLIASKDSRSIHDHRWKERGSKKYISECGTANTAFKKSIFKKVGPFDESFNYGSDTEFSWRVIKNGFKIRYTPEAIVNIDWGNFKDERKRAFRYGEARVKLYRKHPDQKKRLFKYKEDLFSIYSIFYFLYILTLIPITFYWKYYTTLLLIPILKNINKKAFTKLVYDFFWGYGIIKEFLFSNNATNKK